MKKLIKPLKNEKGMAMIEIVPILVLFLVLVSYGLGLWGSIHSAIVQSISARTYAFETFRNRIDLNYHRENSDQVFQMTSFQIRYHTVIAENKPADGTFYSTTRPIAIGRPVALKEVTASASTHNEKVFTLSGRNDGKAEVSPIWVMVGYGMCLNASCGGGL